MRISLEMLKRQAEVTGFRTDILEKVGLLIHLLEALRSHLFLKGRLALKGGTALNLFVFDVPRLSIDIDLNYVGAPRPNSTLFLQRQRTSPNRRYYQVFDPLIYRVRVKICQVFRFPEWKCSRFTGVT